MSTDQLPIEDSTDELAKWLGGVPSAHVQDLTRWSSVTSASGEVVPGSIFVAYQGVAVDSHQFLDEAFEKGAALAVVSDATALADRPGIVVEDGRRALSMLCARQYQCPADRLRLVGITGTNGKTTTHWLVYHTLELLGLPSSRIGSLGYYIDEDAQQIESMTTPPAQEIQKLFAQIVGREKKSCVMEVTSHALLQQRVAGVHFEIGVFTNLTPDHLDYHPDMESYFAAKKQLFSICNSGVVNIDCSYGARIPKEIDTVPLYTFGKAEGATVRMVAFDQHAAGSCLTLEYDGQQYAVETGLIGEYNGYNLTCAFTVCLAMNFTPADIAAALSQTPQPPGRLERFSYKGAQVVIDYAYAADALENVLMTLKPITKGKLRVLFGCGGDRDPQRRPGMGNVAKRLADEVMITSDNPRTEDPEKIVQDILSSGVKPLFIEPDRREAIRQAMESLNEEDLLLISGKGHEDYQIIGTEKVHISDREEVMRIINGSGEG